jgi:hypothetical protein
MQNRRREIDRRCHFYSSTILSVRDCASIENLKLTFKRSEMQVEHVWNIDRMRALELATD